MSCVHRSTISIGIAGASPVRQHLRLSQTFLSLWTTDESWDKGMLTVYFVFMRAFGSVHFGAFWNLVRLNISAKLIDITPAKLMTYWRSCTLELITLWSVGEACSALRKRSSWIGSSHTHVIDVEANHCNTHILFPQETPHGPRLRRGVGMEDVCSLRMCQAKPVLFNDLSS